MNKLLFKIVGVLALFYLLFLGYRYWTNPIGPKVKIRDHIFYVDVAVTSKEKEKGLGFRESLAPDHGMVFNYDHKEQYPFWMKNTNFPLDFLWIDGNVIVDITENVPHQPGVPDNQLKVYKPKVPVDKILELNAGEVAKYGIQIGDTVKFIIN